MGSFVAHDITNGRILSEGTPVVGFLLGPGTGFRITEEPLAWMHHPTSRCALLSLPLRGTYDGYGGIHLDNADGIAGRQLAALTGYSDFPKLFKDVQRGRVRLERVAAPVSLALMHRDSFEYLEELGDPTKPLVRPWKEQLARDVQVMLELAQRYAEMFGDEAQFRAMLGTTDGAMVGWSRLHSAIWLRAELESVEKLGVQELPNVATALASYLGAVTFARVGIDAFDTAQLRMNKPEGQSSIPEDRIGLYALFVEEMARLNQVVLAMQGLGLAFAPNQFGGDDSDDGPLATRMTRDLRALTLGNLEERLSQVIASEVDLEHYRGLANELEKLAGDLRSRIATAEEEDA